MTVAREAGILLVIVPVAFNVAFTLLAMRFDYPSILRRPTTEVLARFGEGGPSLILLWWGFALSAVLFAPLVVLFAAALGGANQTLLMVAVTVGVLAAAVQFLGLIRWPFLVPFLSRVAAESPSNPARTEAVDVVFQSFNRYLGVAVGEHLGYLFTGLWTLLSGIAVLQTEVVPSWLGIGGILIGPILMLCSLEFVGPFEPEGWKLAGRITPVAYIAWSLWLVIIGIALLV
jgi:uncharacterized protein DUF4386